MSNNMSSMSPTTQPGYFRLEGLTASEDGKIFQLFRLEKIFLPSCCPDVRVAVTVVKVGFY